MCVDKLTGVLLVLLLPLRLTWLRARTLLQGTAKCRDFACGCGCHPAWGWTKDEGIPKRMAWWMVFFPPARWGLLDFIRVVVLLLLLLLVLLHHLCLHFHVHFHLANSSPSSSPTSARSGYCWTSTARVWAHWAPRTSTWDLPSSVSTAGPQPGTRRAQWAPLDLNLGPAELSEHRWTSTWDLPSSVSTAGPQRPDRMPEDMPDRTPDSMSDRMPEDMPDKMPEDMPDRMPEDMPDRMPDGMPDKVPECLPDRMPEGMPDRMSDRMPEGMPDKVPECLPARRFAR